MEALLHICEFYNSKFALTGKKFTNASIYDIIQDIAPKDPMLKCNWQHKSYNASEIFSPILTKEGVCFTFNALNSRDIYTNQ